MSETTSLSLGNVTVTGLRELDSCGGHVLLGTAVLLGREHHAEFIRLVLHADGELAPPADAPADALWTFDNMQKFYDGAYYTVRLPGRDGDWAVFIYPYCQ